MSQLAKNTTVSLEGNVIGEVLAISGSGYTVDMVENTSHESADYAKSYLPGLIDADEITIEFNFDHADTNGQIAAEAAGRSRTSKTVVITYPTSPATTWTITGYISGFHVEAAEIAGMITGSINVKPTGLPVFAVAAV